MYYINIHLIRVVFLTYCCFLLTLNAEASAAKEKPITYPEEAKAILKFMGINSLQQSGGEEAISKLLTTIDMYVGNVKNENSLQIGCNAGEQVDYIKKFGYDKICGIDIKLENIHQAKIKYPDNYFVLGDARQINDLFYADNFSLIFLINTASAVEEKINLWQKIKHVTKTHGILAIMDFSIKEGSHLNFHKLNNDPKFPLNISHTKNVMNYIHWDILAIEDVSAEYLLWYKKVHHDIVSDEKKILAAGFKIEEINFLLSYIKNIIDMMEQGNLKADIIIAKKD